MQIRCYRCNWSFAIKKDEIEFVLEALEESGDVHYDARCPSCRHSNRVSIEQLRQAVPRQSEPEEFVEEKSEEDKEG